MAARDLRHLLKIEAPPPTPPKRGEVPPVPAARRFRVLFLNGRCVCGICGKAYRSEQYAWICVASCAHEQFEHLAIETVIAGLHSRHHCPLCCRSFPNPQDAELCLAGCKENILSLLPAEALKVTTLSRKQRQQEKAAKEQPNPPEVSLPLPQAPLPESERPTTPAHEDTSSVEPSPLPCENDPLANVLADSSSLVPPLPCENDPLANVLADSSSLVPPGMSLDDLDFAMEDETPTVDSLLLDQSFDNVLSFSDSFAASARPAAATPVSPASTNQAAPEPERKSAEPESTTTLSLEELAQANAKAFASFTETTSEKAASPSPEVREKSEREPVAAPPPPEPIIPEKPAPDPKLKRKVGQKPFIRIDARYACTVCKSKYFTQQEVKDCFESHPIETDGV